MSILVVDFSTVSPNPLNPLGLKLRKYIWESLDQAEKDPNITSIILTGGKKNFSAGADLTEFGQIQANAAGGSSPSSSSGGAPFYMLTELVSKIENCTKPVIAAISGNALGGGLEVALSCHYRITDGTGKFGLPEVNVGVIPGAGGTQRLPRLVTVPVALDMILTGRVINTKKAKDIGLVDHIAVDSKSTSDLLQHAEKWAKWAALMPLKDRRIGHMKVKESTEELHQIFSYAKKKLPSVEMGGEGVHAAWEAVRACTLPIKQGMEVEEEQFLTTLAGEQGNARRHAFFAVRKAQKPIGKLQGGHVLLKKQSMTNPQDRTTVAVVGAGLMGSGICMVLLQAGFIVHLVDIYKASLDKGVSFLTGTIKSYVKRGKLPAKRAEQMLSSLKPSQKLEDLKACKLVVEAVIEDMKIKKKIFTALDKITPSDCILLSNTSTLDIDEMASVLRPSRQSLFAGWHFFSPAHIMKLVEIVVGKETSLQTSIVIQQLTKRIGKIGVVVGNCDGFVGNRLLISYGAETTLLLEEGAATVARVDKAFLKFGIALGPFQMADLAGLDIGYNIRKQRGWVNPDGTWTEKCPKRYPRIADVIVSQYQRLGQKSGKGWYDYDKKVGKGRKPLPSKEVDDLVHRFANRSGKPFSDEQMIERVLFPLVNEGFKCLEEGIAQQPSDIDVVYLYGYGWPVYRGGPMYWADHTIGLQYLLSRLQEFYNQFPTTTYYKPSKLLEKCVTLNVTVEKYYKLGLHKKQRQQQRYTSKL